MAALKGISEGLLRLAVSVPSKLASDVLARNVSTSCGPLLFRATPALCAEPLKKKKKLDPAIIRAREEKRKKRLEKSIRKLEKNALQLKPLDEMEIPYSVRQEMKARKRPSPKLGAVELERRSELLKAWTAYKTKQHTADVQTMARLVNAQKKALEELKVVNEDLYFEATQIDLGLVPYKARGPTATPPIEKYESPDGEFIDITRKWE